MTRKRKLEPPFFEIGPKNYLYGDQIVELARMALRNMMCVSFLQHPMPILKR